MLKKPVFTLFLWVFLPPLSMFAQNNMTMSLQQAQDYAVLNNPQMQTSLLDIENGRTTLQNRTAAGLPQINASVGYNHFITLPTSLIPAEFFGGEPGEFAEVQFGTPENMTAGISASQLIFSGPYLYGVQAARVYVELLEQQSKVTASDVKKSVELAYYATLISDEMITMAEKNLEVVNNTLREVSEMNKAGFVEAIDVDRLRITQSSLQTMVNNAKRQKDFALQLLKFQMGLDLTQTLALTDSLSGMQSDILLVQGDQNFMSRPELGVMSTTKKLNEINIQVNKAAYYPSLAIIGSYEQAAQRNEFNFFDGNEPWFETFLVGVQLNIPIFSGMQKSAAVESAQIGYEKALVTEKTLIQSIQLEVAQYTTDYQNAQAEMENAQANTVLAEKIYNTALIKYREGLGSSLELTDAEGTLLNAQTNYINALYNLLSAKTNLKKALGYL